MSDLLDRYLEGWAENNLSKISSAMAPGYCFDDPHVGQFSRWSISLYLKGFGQDSPASVDARLGISAFSFTGRPTGHAVAASSRSFREAPRLGLTGVTTITIGEHGVVAEAVAYDLNPALDVLRGRPTTSYAAYNEHQVLGARKPAFARLRGQLEAIWPIQWVNGTTRSIG